MWKPLGLAAFGAPYRVDGATPRVSESHQWITNATPNGSGGSAFPFLPLRGATVVDHAAPVAGSGTPRLAPLWMALCLP